MPMPQPIDERIPFFPAGRSKLESSHERLTRGTPLGRVHNTGDRGTIWKASAAKELKDTLIGSLSGFDRFERT